MFFFKQGDPITRLTLMNQAAELYLIQILEKESLVGLVTFDSIAIVQNNLIRMINDSSYLEISAKLPQEAAGGTSICNGLRKGFEVKEMNYYPLPLTTSFTFSQGREFTGSSFTNSLT